MPLKAIFFDYDNVLSVPQLFDRNGKPQWAISSNTSLCLDLTLEEVVNNFGHDVRRQKLDSFFTELCQRGINLFIASDGSKEVILHHLRQAFGARQDITFFPPASVHGPCLDPTGQLYPHKVHLIQALMHHNGWKADEVLFVEDMYENIAPCLGVCQTHLVINRHVGMGDYDMAAIRSVLYSRVIRCAALEQCGGDMQSRVLLHGMECRIICRCEGDEFLIEQANGSTTCTQRVKGDSLLFLRSIAVDAAPPRKQIHMTSHLRGHQAENVLAQATPPNEGYVSRGMIEAGSLGFRRLTTCFQKPPRSIRVCDHAADVKTVQESILGVLYDPHFKDEDGRVSPRPVSTDFDLAKLQAQIQGDAYTGPRPQLGFRLQVIACEGLSHDGQSQCKLFFNLGTGYALPSGISPLLPGDLLEAFNDPNRRTLWKDQIIDEASSQTYRLIKHFDRELGEEQLHPDTTKQELLARHYVAFTLAFESFLAIASHQWDHIGKMSPLFVERFRDCLPERLVADYWHFA
eukprot:CAMPEP_0113236334 /NCGR_PEP_ID=MMETSP0008_2-20120614/4035_1 /TAXON_ID=97485 /ORGANISM="Prymnesium parvum" /LENGTH=516 /DNA_ID=CAMNT_0000083323 /DNA_START=30 /DNA_END=1580 /DNA_ORIENTATION=- /assembly_acc=CAM_ASM_000153